MIQNEKTKRNLRSNRKFHSKIGDDVAFLADDDRQDQMINSTVLQDRARTTFDKTVADIETKINRTKSSLSANAAELDEDDIFPGAAKDMGSGEIFFLFDQSERRRSF